MPIREKAITIESSISGPNTEKVLTTENWCLFNAKLDSTATGTNRLIFGAGSRGWIMEPGDITPSFVLPPGTNIKISTNSTNPVTFSFSVVHIPLENVFSTYSLLNMFLKFIIQQGGKKINILSSLFNVGM